MNRAPRPGPSLSAQMRPPWASTMPRHTARPSPSPSTRRSPSPPSRRENLRNSRGSCWAVMPRPRSATQTATWESSRQALTVITDPSGEYLAALDSRLSSTWTMRCRSAARRGKSGARSTSILFPTPPSRNTARAWPTRAARAAGSVANESVPASIRATSSRSRIRLRIRSACWSMMRKNWRASAGSKGADEPSTAAAEPLIEVRGVSSSWLTMPRNSARCRPSSSRGVMSWAVTTSDTTSPSSERMGVALTRVVTVRPSGKWMTISSARTVSPLSSACCTGRSPGEIRRPSARRKVSAPSSSSRERPVRLRSPASRRASRFRVSNSPLLASKTRTPTGVVSTSASRSLLARCSSW